MIEDAEQYREHWDTWTRFTKGVVKACLGIGAIVVVTLVLVHGGAGH